jgi:hypothetical protein
LSFGGLGKRRVGCRSKQQHRPKKWVKFPLQGPLQMCGKLKFRPEKQEGSNPDGLTLLDMRKPTPSR